MLACSKGHSYDRAKEGYINLLLANRKRSLEPGDSKDMLSARSRVHEAGLFEPLANAIEQQMTHMPNTPTQVLDMGCGEGYYSAALKAALPSAEVLGIDIAKPAVRWAAKKCPEGSFAVASMADIPLPDASLDLVASVFAPIDEAELSRVLKPGGSYLKITPAPRHLWELRSLLYNTPRPHKDEPPQPAHFESVVKELLHYSVDIEGEMLRDLVAMTPYAHRGQRENRERLSNAEKLTIQMSFNISLMRYQPEVAVGEGALKPFQWP
ncbi:MAG: 23S rRNA (guanine745-N1)-methyltransferase [Halioglobus sp.]